MSRLHSLRLFVGQRLSAAVDEIFGHFERTISEYEQEMDRRHRDLLDEVLPPEAKLRRAGFPVDVQQVFVSFKEVRPEQQEWSSSLDQGDPTEPTHIKEEEEEELWTSREQLQGVDEVKEEDGEKPRVETEADGEDSEGPEPDRTSDPEPDRTSDPEPDRSSNPNHYFQTVSGSKVSKCSETEVSDDDCKSGPVSDVNCNAVKKSFTCCECGRKFGRKDSLRRHMRFHTGEKPYSCSVCGKRFSQRPNLIRHMRCHSGEKPFSCSFCDASFAVRSALVNHMRIHTGEKPFSCLYCDKSFTQKGGLKKHMTVHTGEKPYSCPVCDKSFSQKANLTYHFSVHTGHKQFSCSVCDKRFTWQSQVKSHKCVGENSSA
ncbi:gastrula zinc finger protein XlCGF57.1 [Larimichthys crocea]|uniref:gastrula zinc finger protein XlCGF57.1 n=1 Tax=Larimichthys crocea TaxID=215358 RepID=UPI000F5E8ED0|nr:gastrula zinc finger protein XlCGF57.1 [Larimichthys crocea]